MSIYAINEKENDPVTAFNELIKNIITEKIADSVLVPARTPYSKLPMPTLFSDPEKMIDMDPLAPVAPFNAAKQAAIIAKHPAGKKIAVILKPCELRALTELIKLNQCQLENIILIGIECFGRIENKKYLRHAEESSELTQQFISGSKFRDEITETCKSCVHFIPKNCDINISTIGVDSVGFQSNSETGDKILEASKLKKSGKPADKDSKIDELLLKRKEHKENLFKNTGEILKDMDKFQNLIGSCLNCYNCRTACPVCYCKECVFQTDIFLHNPETLLMRSAKKGALKMPTDTSMFHMTRLSHIAHSCVGCGQCTSVCSSEIPVADIFRTVSEKTQEFFDYEPGRDITEQIPMLAYKEEK